jgi:drug/metabolite transporter (DMT)-like permease
VVQDAAQRVVAQRTLPKWARRAYDSDLVSSISTKLILAFAAVYVVWGSTYLAIKHVVTTMPPLGSAGVRFIVAGAILYIFLRLREPFRPTRLHWRSAAIIGSFLLLGGNGLVVLAGHAVPSAMTALVVGATPMWMVLLDWLFFRGPRPTARIGLGLALGFGGVLLLVDPHQLDLSGKQLNPLMLALPMGACFFWSIGSLYARRAPLPPNAMMATALEMIAGGVALCVAATLRGEWTLIDPARFSTASVVALVYLTLVGSLVGFSAYVYLLKHATPAAASSYAFVNPLVAVMLGWIDGETLRPTVFLAGALVVGAVVLITLRSRRKADAAPVVPAHTAPAAVE